MLAFREGPLQHLDPLVSAQRGNPSPVPPYSPPEHSSCEVPATHHQHNPAGVCAEALQGRCQLLWLLAATLRQTLLLAPDGITSLSPRTEHTPLLAHASPQSHSWERLIAWGSDLARRTHPSHKGPPGPFRQVKATPWCSPFSLCPPSQPAGP